MKLIVISLVIVFSFLCNLAKGQDSGIVQLVSGKISGNFNPETGIRSYKGIPYAKPPVGNLRWKAPLPPETWKGIRECKNFSAIAMQGKPEPFSMWTSEFIAPASPLSEDCLYLNIWTDAKSDKKKRPVIVYIHGGGFVAGSGSVPIYDGEAMAQEGVVFVTINYRLGVFGFLAHPELTKESAHNASGNYALLDQIESLKWIRKNIEAFGGDSNNVTIAGQSAGAVSVNYLMASPLAIGLFQKAIAESGGAVVSTIRLSQPKNLVEAEASGLKLVESLHVASINDLRKINSEELLKVRASNRLIVDGYSVIGDLNTIFSKGEQNDVPLLLGWNANEGNFLGSLLDSKAFIQNVKSEYGNSADKFLAFFPAPNDSIAEKSQLNYSALLAFGLQVFKWMELQTKTGKSAVFLYHFSRKVPFGEGQKDFGAFHSGEVAYAYHTLHMSKVRPWTDIDYKLEKAMSAYWINFAKNGNPNGANLPIWEPCSSTEYNTMVLGDSLELKPIPHMAELKFLRDFFESK